MQLLIPSKNLPCSISAGLLDDNVPGCDRQLNFIHWTFLVHINTFCSYGNNDNTATLTDRNKFQTSRSIQQCFDAISWYWEEPHIRPLAAIKVDVLQLPARLEEAVTEVMRCLERHLRNLCRRSCHTGDVCWIVSTIEDGI